jgi:NitT/TauT family transport system ATP-binding protein
VREVTQAVSARGKAIRINGLGKTYQTRSGGVVEALTPIDLDIKPGEFLVIVGPSGCGKSTLLYQLAGLARASVGEAYVGGKRIDGPDIDHSMVFQSYALFPWLNVRENIEFGLKQKGMGAAQRRSISDQFLRIVGLEDFAEKAINELSGGMKQRVAIARTFAVDPSVIFMDEPFGALDALTRRTLQWELIRIWQASAKTIVFITHSVAESVQLADRVVVMTARPGRIKEVVTVSLPHPRDGTSDPFRAVERRIFMLLDEELAKSSPLSGARAP